MLPYATLGQRMALHIGPIIWASVNEDFVLSKKMVEGALLHSNQ